MSENRVPTCPGFKPLWDVYRPIGRLYREIARERCVHCGLHQNEHLIKDGWTPMHGIDGDR